ncbi:DNA cytosine methyltransferase [Kordiimonas pumila]|uniref:DNA (cytosine-5-)-methyltransferase n=1 Tax=Kordiimonas pumila TaxID=2161677 RepID=A0ABV7D0A0_9PROT|nr:DNA cytosine methyltransferase [Kordiimonas pumila]
MKNHKLRPYPIVDLFAGPGGLGEGFASLSKSDKHVFQSVACIERDEHAHKTLQLRHFFRSFRKGKVPKAYYDYISGQIDLISLQEMFPKQWSHVRECALRISLGSDTHDQVKNIITEKLKDTKKWALVGGPPCQAYSLVGRSRRANDPDFAQDEKHFLYKEYLKIIIDHSPPVFVMENVKGLVSAKVDGVSIAHKITQDLSRPKRAVGEDGNGISYKLYSLSEQVDLTGELSPASFIIKAEEYGVPQARHRMFIVGIRSDLDIIPGTLKKSPSPTVKDVLDGMPRIRSGVSKGGDSTDRWTQVVRDVASKLSYSLKAPLPKSRSSKQYIPPKVMTDWYSDKNLNEITGHETRSHMESDLYRYLFAASYAESMNVSPKLADFPHDLLPNHRNVEAGRAGKMFSDRFRVQIPNKFSTTVTSHISKDGHYFIHYDASQCRSLTVREAARLQTFPDNYHFEGPRTQQYHQVGNAVPPYLAKQIAEIIADVLDRVEV